MQMPWQETTGEGEREGLTWTELLVVLVVFAVIVIIAISTKVSS